MRGSVVKMLRGFPMQVLLESYAPRKLVRGRASNPHRNRVRYVKRLYHALPHTKRGLLRHLSFKQKIHDLNQELARENR